MIIDNTGVSETGIAAYRIDGSTIIYDKNFPNGSPQAGQDDASLYEVELQKLYDSDAEVRALADEIHARRLLPGPTCFSCMESAAAKVCWEELGLDDAD